MTVANPGTIASNVTYLPVRWTFSTVTVAIDPVVIENGKLAVGDFNNDNKADISVANVTEDNVLFTEVYLSQGNGRFVRVQGTPAPYFTIPEDGNITADFNNDGNLDAAVCTSTGSPDKICTIFLGDGKGGLASANSSFFKGSAVAADVNGDGILDAVALFNDSYLCYLLIYLGNGDGTFRLGSTITLNSGTSGVQVIGDFNRDGKLDVAVPGGNSGFIAVLLGNGDGTFQGEVDYPSSQGGSVAVLADINGDGKLDIVTSNGQPTMQVLLGKGDGTFVEGSPIAMHCGSNLQIADLNGDGQLDLATLIVDNMGNQMLNIALGNGDGTFQHPFALLAGQDLVPSGIVSIADFNNDCRLDFAITGSVNPSRVLLQTPAK